MEKSPRASCVIVDDPTSGRTTRPRLRREARASRMQLKLKRICDTSHLKSAHHTIRQQLTKRIAARLELVVFRARPDSTALEKTSAVGLVQRQCSTGHGDQSWSYQTARPAILVERFIRRRQSCEALAMSCAYISFDGICHHNLRSTWQSLDFRICVIV